jgi:hypothetical protein
VKLEDIGVEALGQRRYERHLERPGGDDHLLSFVASVAQLDQVAPVGPADRAHAAAQLDWQVEATRVVGEVCHHVVAPRVRVGVSGEGQAGQAVVAHGGKEPERIPPPRQAAAGSAAASRIVNRRACWASK